MSAAPRLTALLAALLAAGCDADRPASTAHKPGCRHLSAFALDQSPRPPPPDADRS